MIHLTNMILLGMLMERPMHGYELQQQIQSRRLDVWAHILSGSIYYALNKMEKEGLVQYRIGRTHRSPPAQDLCGDGAGKRNVQRAAASRCAAAPARDGLRFFYHTALVVDFRQQGCFFVFNAE
ncbi:PadR family transcriptional regulator [Paenibacillus sp. TAB 01]|uniref:PadR family transcriptional regulator n=1 Tax=Paenibacillus sp. TAB 01 TaxID=3368988 RepID=UPI0037505D39